MSRAAVIFSQRHLPQGPRDFTLWVEAGHHLRLVAIHGSRPDFYLQATSGEARALAAALTAAADESDRNEDRRLLAERAT